MTLDLTRRCSVGYGNYGHLLMEGPLRRRDKPQNKFRGMLDAARLDVGSLKVLATKVLKEAQNRNIEAISKKSDSYLYRLLDHWCIGERRDSFVACVPALSVALSTDAESLLVAFDTFAADRLHSPMTSRVKSNPIVSEQLARLVPRDHLFRQMGILDLEPHRLCVDEMLSLETLRGAQGLPAAMITVHAHEDYADIPGYVADEIPAAIASLEGKEDRDKATIIDWSRSPDDAADGKVVMHLAMSKYSRKLAMRRAQDRLRQDLISRKLRLSHDSPLYDDVGTVPRLHCNLHCDGIILTGDSRIILSQRTAFVDDSKLLWGASFGESMDWQKDRYDGGGLHPARTVWRGMAEELNLVERDILAQTKIRFIELGFDWGNIINTLFVVVEMQDVESEYVLWHASRSIEHGAELRTHSSMSLDLRTCTAAIVDGHVDGKLLDRGAKFKLLLVCLDKFGSDFASELARY